MKPMENPMDSLMAIKKHSEINSETPKEKDLDSLKDSLMVTPRRSD